MIRAIELIAAFLLLTGAISWLLWTYVIKPREDRRIEAEKNTKLAVAAATEDYLKIRKTWLDISLNEHPDFFMSNMNDMNIEEVREFQRHMVSMNTQYGKLQEAKTDEIFVQKTILLRELFDEATIRTKQLER